jgi:hypothetical protein
VNGCNSLVVVALHAPQLSKLELQELGDLKGACLQQVRPQPRVCCIYSLVFTFLCLLHGSQRDSFVAHWAHHRFCCAASMGQHACTHAYMQGCAASLCESELPGNHPGPQSKCACHKAVVRHGAASPLLAGSAGAALLAHKSLGHIRWVRPFN